MAIFRAGKRIGNMDIRIGLPRDKSLDNVEGDKRLKEKFIAGNRSVSTLNRFMAEIAKGEGVARSNRFLVRFYPPYFSDITSDRSGKIKDTAEGMRAAQTMNELKEFGRNIELFCTQIVLPSRDIKAENFVTYGPGRQMPTAYHFQSSIQAEFMADKYLRQRSFFEAWQNLMFNENSHDLRYYENYIGTMDIYQLGMYKEDNAIRAKTGMSDNLRVTYAVRCHEVYPETIGEVQYQSLADEMIPMPLPITFSFRRWTNLTLDQINKAGAGKFKADIPHIETDNTKNLLQKMFAQHPELRRASRDVVDKIRRDIPIGRATGGRVFPPYGKRMFPPFF